MYARSAVPLLLVIAACGGESAGFGAPRTVPREQRPTQWDAPVRERLGMSEPKAQAAWSATTPAGWEQLPAQPSRFRDLLFRVAGQPDTECYLTGGVGGGVAGNMRRWYVDQAGRTEVPAAESLPLVELGDRPARLVELTGTISGKPDQGMLLAFASQGDVVTTLKFTGPASVVTAQKDNFLALARSIRRDAGATAPAATAGAPATGELPSGHPTTGNATTGNASAGDAAAARPSAAPFVAEVPAGWQVKADSPRPLHHTFGAEGEIYVSQLGGAPRAMLDIWRGEMSLPPLSDAEFAALPKVPMLGGEALLLDLAGEFRSMMGKQIPAARMLVAALHDGTTITFAKLVGTAADVQAQTDAFRAFCASLRRAP